MSNNINGFASGFDFDKWKELAKLDESAFEIQKKLALFDLVHRSMHHRDLLKDSMKKFCMINCSEFVSE